MKTMSYVAMALALVAASPAFAVETLTATFTAPDGGVSKYSYAGIVRVTVSGVGQAMAKRYNDAFYLYSPVPIEHPDYYGQLTFSTSTITGTGRMLGAVRDVVGGLPAYDPSHVYSFLLDTGTATPTTLHFGVSDGLYSDNTGAFTISLAVPEPATWGLMIAGFVGVGVALRRKGRSVVVAA